MSLRTSQSGATPTTSSSSASGPRSMPEGRLPGTFFRIDLDRSLQLHPRLVLVISLLGLGAAVAWFFTLHPALNASALTLNTLQIPGILLVGGILLGFIAAILAYKLDRRVHSAYDVERILGFPPMLQIPEFDEVSTDIADDYLFSLAAGIEFAAHQEGITSCVFTGSASGTGVTTLVGRVHSMLQGLGRPTVLIDASRTLPLEQDMQNKFVLTDTAPILFSAHAEYFARMAGCTIVVLESGVTTRIRLRAVARALQRINPYSVGFVLNRVPLAKADPAFRTAICGLEKHLQSMGRSTAGQTLMSALAPSPPAKQRREESVVPAEEAPLPVPREETKQPQVQAPAEPELKEPAQEEIPLLVARAEVLHPVNARQDIQTMVEDTEQPEAIEAVREEFRLHEAQPEASLPTEAMQEKPQPQETAPEVLQLVEAMQEGFEVREIQPGVLPPLEAEVHGTQPPLETDVQEAQPPLEAELDEAQPDLAQPDLAPAEAPEPEEAKQEAHCEEPVEAELDDAHPVLARSEPQTEEAKQEAEPEEEMRPPVPSLEPEPELAAFFTFEQEDEPSPSLPAAAPEEMATAEEVSMPEEVPEPARPSAARRVRTAITAVLEQFLSEAAHRGTAAHHNRPNANVSPDLNGREPCDSNPAYLDREGALTPSIASPDAGLRSHLLGRRATTGSGQVPVLWEPLRVEKAAPLPEFQAGPATVAASLPDAPALEQEPFAPPDPGATAHSAAQRSSPEDPGSPHPEVEPPQVHPPSRLSSLRSLLLGIDSLRTRTATLTPPEEEHQTSASASTSAAAAEREPGDLRPILNPFTENWSPFSDQMPSGLSVKPEFFPVRNGETPDDLDRAARSNWIEIPSESDDPFKRH